MTKNTSEITCMEFDEHHRKLIIGNSLGQLKVFDILSGIMTHELEAHGKEVKSKSTYPGLTAEQRQKNLEASEE